VSPLAISFPCNLLGKSSLTEAKSSLSSGLASTLSRGVYSNTEAKSSEGEFCVLAQDLKDPYHLNRLDTFLRSDNNFSRSASFGRITFNMLEFLNITRSATKRSWASSQCHQANAHLKFERLVT
jgi:hypothetical protein